MPRNRIAAATISAAALTALMCSAPIAAHADGADTVKPVIADTAFGTVKGIVTFTVTQAEDAPKRAYVEIQQLGADAKWKKLKGQEFKGTNEFALTVDTAALAEGVATQVKVSSWDLNDNHTSKTFPVVIDRTKPVANLVTPATGGPFNTSTIELTVDATDNLGLDRVTANVYQAGKLVKSTSSSAGGATAATHSKSVTLPDGEYSIRFNASDLAGSVSTTGQFAFEIDTVAPTVTPKDETPAKGVFGSAPSFKLSDAGVGEVDYVEINGVKKDLTNNKWSDLNTGGYTPAQGVNTIVAVDTAGNRSEPVTFTFDSVAPKAEVKPGVEAVDGVYTKAPSFKLSDAGIGKVDYLVVNGVKKDLTDNKWSDLNAGAYTPVQGKNTIVVVDTAGNASEVTFEFDDVEPVVTAESETWESKESGRWAVTLTFSEPVSGASLGQGWYGDDTVYTKVFYRAKTVDVAFTDLAGNPGSYPLVVDAVAPAAE
ncbi:Ig-like domain-containing protein [Agromyces sp. LHK192]|uniref:Ig-like domain-containing protein n=1 Tax=Agromyces sp. LHK192 TaxID=2498704 RepID=UPI000FDB0849|nr:Ig-like domain-containing protein [Agromyces sp. LHK192]